jgi:hypothetical protein
MFRGSVGLVGTSRRAKRVVHVAHQRVGCEAHVERNQGSDPAANDPPLTAALYHGPTPVPFSGCTAGKYKLASAGPLSRLVAVVRMVVREGQCPEWPPD